MKKGDRVTTPDGAGTIVAEWLDRGLRRFGPLKPTDSYVVVLDEGRGQWRRIYRRDELEPLERVTS